MSFIKNSIFGTFRDPCPKGDFSFFENFSNDTGQGSCKAGCVKRTDGGEQKVGLVKLWLLFT